MSDGRLRYEEVVADVETTVDAALVDIGDTRDFEFPRGPYDYECAGDVLALSYADAELTYAAEYRRA